MTPAQSRAARALINMTQVELAERAGVSHSTVKNFEGVLRSTYRRNLVDLQRALEEAGIEFLEDGRPGVRLSEGLASEKRRRRSGIRVRA